MDNKRREFLKIAGISALAGLGAPAVVNRSMTGSISPLPPKRPANMRRIAASRKSM